MRSGKFLRETLQDIRNKKISVKQGERFLKGLPGRNIGFAHIDLARKARCGFPEVIYCEGKTVMQLKRIAKEILAYEDTLLLTRLSETKFKRLKTGLPSLHYNKHGRIAYYSKKKKAQKSGKTILIVTGGTSDIPVAEEARTTLDIMGDTVKYLYDVGAAGIHRLLNYSEKLVKANVIIVVAGMEGALASVVSGLVSKPIIAVPTSCGYGVNFSGLAPLLTMLNTCAPGVTVVNIDNGFGAAYAAHMINNL